MIAGDPYKLHALTEAAETVERLEMFAWPTRQVPVIHEVAVEHDAPAMTAQSPQQTLDFAAAAVGCTEMQIGNDDGIEHDALLPAIPAGILASMAVAAKSNRPELTDEPEAHERPRASKAFPCSGLRRFAQTSKRQ
jgi:hypothetical protein